MASPYQVFTSLVLVCALSALQATTTAALTAVYMPTSCGVPTIVDPSLQVESATGLSYTNNMDCNITFTVASPYFILANIKRFELERKYSGVCTDYLNLHDGGDLSSSTLNTDRLCGSSLTDTTYLSTGQEITVHFVTDSTTVLYGFNVILTAVTIAPCGVTQHQCNNSYCIDSTLVCDSYDQCGDASDEDNCATITSSDGTNWIPLIVGLSVGMLVVLLVVAVIVYRVHRRNKWRRFTNEHIHREDLPDPEPSYPVTHKYFRGIRGHPDLHTYEATEDVKVAEEEKPGVDIKS